MRLQLYSSENQSEVTCMRGSFVYLYKFLCRKFCALVSVLLVLCLLVSCGPEPGEEQNGGLPGAAEFFPGQDPEEGKDKEAGSGSSAGLPFGKSDTAFAGETAGRGLTGADAGSLPGDTVSAGASTGAAAEDMFVHPIQGEITRTDEQTLEELQGFLNEDSSYGFLLSSYDIPEEIDLNQVFYSGAGFKQEELTKKEKELLLDRIPQEEITTPVVRLKEDQIEELLSKKAGITYDEAKHPLDKADGWAHIGRYKSWYALRGDTNRRYIKCTDAWQQGNLYIIHYQLMEQAPEETENSAKSALYRPTYEVQLQKTGEDYRFCYNVVWTQKNLIEAQSYRAELKPVGQVFFAPYYPDTDMDEKADVTFVLEKDRAVLAVLGPMEASNIRTDRIFEGVDAVDFTDYNQDGYTDILTICTYTKISDDGRKAGEIREARVYAGQKDAVPLLDTEKTEAVNRDVEVLNITNVTEYLTGKSDGKAKKYSSWKEAYADHIAGIAEDEYEGFGLIYLNDDRTPELVQRGATTAKGATIVVYHNGTLEETWLNRRDFQYLEYENLLYSPSGAENLHFDTIYSISGGKLAISTQGYYGNSSFARVRFDEDGKEVRDYFWEGGQVSERGYLDGISFLFDLSRAKTCQGDQLLTAAQLREKLK